MVKATYYGQELELDFPKDKLPPMKTLDEIDALFPSTLEHKFLHSSTPGGSVLHYRVCMPTTTPLKGVVVWQHGIGSSSANACKVPSTGKYTNFALLAEEFTKAGYGLYLLDMKGHGLSEGIRFYIPNSWTANRDDFVAFVQHVAKEQPSDTPFFVGGDSYGGNLAIHVAKMFQDKKCEAPPGFRGLVLIAPAIAGDLPPYPVVFVLRYLLKPLYPTWIPFFMPHPVHPDAVWTDPEIRALQTDPEKVELGLQNCATPFRLGTADNLLSALEHARAHSCPGLKVPFFVSHGAQDSGVLIEGTEDYLIDKCAVSKEDYQYVRVEDAKHDIMGEPCRESIMKQMCEWMDSRLEKKYSP